MQVKKSLLLGMVFTYALLFGSTISFFSVHVDASNSMVGECFQNIALCQENDETDADTESTESASVNITVMDYIKIFFSLIVVLGLLIFVLKFLNKRNLAYQHSSTIRNIGGISVGPQKSVQIVQVGKSIFVVGVGDEVRLLKEVSSEEEKEQLLAMYNEKQVIGSTKPYIFELFSSKKKQQPVKKTANFEQQFKAKIAEIQKERSDELQQWNDETKERDRQ